MSVNKRDTLTTLGYVVAIALFTVLACAYYQPKEADAVIQESVVNNAASSPDFSLVEEGFQIESARRYLNYSFAAYCNPAKMSSPTWRKLCPLGDACDLVLHTPVISKNSLLAYVAWSEQHKEITVAFRGTVDFSNVVTDIDTDMIQLVHAPFKEPSWYAHKGFYNGYLSLRPKIITAIKQLRKIHPNDPLVVTGHSMGAALATVAAADLVINQQMPATLFTFGSPRVFNKAAANAISNALIIKRVVAGGDPVPHLPPCKKCKEGDSITHSIVSGIVSGVNWVLSDTDHGFWHVAQEVWIPKSCTFQQCSLLSAYQMCDASGEDPKCSNSVEPIDYEISAHTDGYMGIPGNKVMDDSKICS